VELNSADAQKLNVKDGDEVMVTVEGATARVTARVDGRAPAGIALMPESLGPTVPSGSSRVTISKA
jgi:formylmethanofuran dehydrogenase subunit D